MGKRISQLTALTSASLDTTIVGVDNGVTYKIELDTLADAVKDRINTLDDIRLDLLEAFTASYTASVVTSGTISGSSQLTASFDERYTLSGSVTQTTWDNISGKPSGIVSQSTDLSSINTFTQSIDSRVDSLESWSSSLTDTFATDLEVSIVSSSVAATIGIISQATGLATTGSNTFYGDQTISGSQYISGSIILTNGAIIKDNANESISFGYQAAEINQGTQSVAIGQGAGNYNQNNGAVAVGANAGGFNQGLRATAIGSLAGGINQGEYAVALGNFAGGTDQAPYSIVINATGTALNNTTSSLIIAPIRNITGSSGVLQYDDTTKEVSYNNNYLLSSSFDNFTESINSRVYELEAATSSYITSIPVPTYISSGPTSPGGAVVANVNTIGINFSEANDFTFNRNGTITFPDFTIQSTAFTGLPAGLISGSSQLTSSFDTRYTLSGSVVSGTTPDGTISGSTQISALGFITGSYVSSSTYTTDSASFSSRILDITASVNINTGSFVTTASFNAFTASAQMVTTGSNSFNGTQIITGSLIITTGSFIGTQITTNTASLYLTSGSNLYVQNNGVVEITGSLIVSGSSNFNVNSLNINGRSGDEGGEINLAVPETNTTLSTRVVVDIWRNRFRIFDGNTNGVFIDLSKAPTGVNGEITWKASGYVDAGTFVQLDNIKATVTTSSNRGLSIGAVSTNFSANIGGTFSNSAGAGGNSTQNIAYTTTASSSVFGWNFIAEGDTSTYIINDKTNSRMYRITMMIGPAYLGNFISIERLH